MRAATETVDLAGWRFCLARDTNHPAGERPEELIALARAVAGGGAGRPLRRSRRAASFRCPVRTGPTPDAEVFIKLIDSPRGLARLKAMIRGSSAKHVARTTQRLNAAGFAAPPVLLYGRETSSGRELLLMPVVHGDGPFKALETALGCKRAMLRALGAEVARLHRAGFVHGDLTPYNMFVARGEPPQFTFVDHERTRMAFFAGRRRRQLRNLVQLGRFDLPGLSRTDRMRVLRGYAANLNGPSWLSLRKRAAAMLEGRIRRGGLEPVRRT